MHTLLIILKITGIALLAILILVICLILMVLFIPLRYRIKAYFEEEKEKNTVSVKARWLLGIVSINYIYPGNGGGVGIRVFGIPVLRKSKKRKPEKKKNKKKKVKNPKGEKQKVSEDRTEISETENAEVKSGVKKRKKSKARKRRLGKEKRKKYSFSKIKAYYKLLSDSENKKAYGFAKKTITALIKHLAPKTLKADMVIGLGDPCNTGLLFGALGIIISFVKGKYNITPDFYNKRICGRVYAKGRIRSVIVIYHLIRIFTNSDIKKVTGQFKTIR